MDLLVLEDVSGIQQVGVYRYATGIVQVGSGYPGAVDL